jgi:hypothetical protein
MDQVVAEAETELRLVLWFDELSLKMQDLQGELGALKGALDRGERGSSGQRELLQMRGQMEDLRREVRELGSRGDILRRAGKVVVTLDATGRQALEDRGLGEVADRAVRMVAQMDRGRESPGLSL